MCGQVENKYYMGESGYAVLWPEPEKTNYEGKKKKNLEIYWHNPHFPRVCIVDVSHFKD